MTAGADTDVIAGRGQPPDLDHFFRPRTVAVIGATDAPGRPVTVNWRLISRWAQAAGAAIYPINPNRPAVDGIATHASICDVDDEIDLAVIMVSDAEGALREVARKRARFAVVFTGDFAETGDEGARRQRDLVSILDGTGVRMLGPNTNLNAFENFRDDLPGKAISLITQSGHQGRPVFQGQELGIRFNHWAPTGNEADLDAADFIRYFASLPETGAIAAYLEGFRHGPSFQRAIAAAARRGVPVVVVKIGRTEVGRSWAQSHTGHLAGADDVVSGLLRQYGVTRVDGLDELLDTAAMFARSAPPTANGVCVYSISGGTSAHMADLLAAAGIPLPELTTATQARLREWIPGYLRISNPVDSGGHPVGDWRGRKILDALVADPTVGVLIVPITGAFAPMSDHFVADLVDVSTTTDKPICVIWGSPVGTESAYRDVLLASEIPVFRTFRNCVTAVRAYLDFHAFQARIATMADPETAPVPGPGRDLLSSAEPGRDAFPSPELAPAQAGVAALSELESKRLLARFGIPVTRDILCRSADEVVAAAGQLGVPVVLKASSAAITHKSDLGLVRVGVRSEPEMREAFADFRRTVGRVPGAQFEGVLVCEQVTGGVEAMVGIAADEMFGPVVMAGIGGVGVEVYRDVSFRVPPFSKTEARRMLSELTGSVLLRGYRGAPAVNVEALVDVIMSVQRLAQQGIVAELDINPLLVTPDRAVALDALAIGVHSS